MTLGMALIPRRGEEEGPCRRSGSVILAGRLRAPPNPYLKRYSRNTTQKSLKILRMMCIKGPEEGTRACRPRDHMWMLACARQGSLPTPQCASSAGLQGLSSVAWQFLTFSTLADLASFKNKHQHAFNKGVNESLPSTM